MIESVVVLAFAAIFKAVADTLAHHYSTSVFKNSNPRFWNPNISYKFVKYLPLTKYRADGWHLANTGMIVCFIAVAVLHSPILNWYWEILIAGTVFNVTFNIFYNKILR